MSDPLNLTLADLAISPLNVRFPEKDAETVEALSASIVEQGLLEQLLVHPAPEDGPWAERALDAAPKYGQRDPAAFALYVELGNGHWQEVRSYVDLGDHYLSELIAQAQADGHFPGLTINQALSLINQMVVCYVQPIFLIMISERLSEDKLARIIDTVFAGLSAKNRGAAGVSGLRVA